MSINAVKQRNEARLMALPDVVSVGVGRNENGEAVIVVGLSVPNAKTESRLPSVLEGYAVEVRIIGSVKAQ